MTEPTPAELLDLMAAWQRKVWTSKQSPQTDDHPPRADGHPPHTAHHGLHQNRPRSRLQDIPWEVIEQFLLNSDPKVPWHRVSRAFRRTWLDDCFRARLLLHQYGKAHAFYWALANNWLRSPQLCDALESKGAILSAHFIEYAHSRRHQAARYPKVDRWLLTFAGFRYGPEFYRQEGTISDHEHWVRSFTAEGADDEGAEEDEDDESEDSTMADRPVLPDSTTFALKTHRCLRVNLGELRRLLVQRRYAPLPCDPICDELPHHGAWDPRFDYDTDSKDSQHTEADWLLDTWTEYVYHMLCVAPQLAEAIVANSFPLSRDRVDGLMRHLSGLLSDPFFYPESHEGSESISLTVMNVHQTIPGVRLSPLVAAQMLALPFLLDFSASKEAIVTCREIVLALHTANLLDFDLKDLFRELFLGTGISLIPAGLFEVWHKRLDELRVHLSIRELCQSLSCIPWDGDVCNNIDCWLKIKGQSLTKASVLRTILSAAFDLIHQAGLLQSLEQWQQWINPRQRRFDGLSNEHFRSIVAEEVKKREISFKAMKRYRTRQCKISNGLQSRISCPVPVLEPCLREIVSPFGFCSGQESPAGHYATSWRPLKRAAWTDGSRERVLTVHTTHGREFIRLEDICQPEAAFPLGFAYKPWGDRNPQLRSKEATGSFCDPPSARSKNSQTLGSFWDPPSVPLKGSQTLGGGTRPMCQRVHHPGAAAVRMCGRHDEQVGRVVLEHMYLNDLTRHTFRVDLVNGSRRPDLLESVEGTRVSRIFLSHLYIFFELGMPLKSSIITRIGQLPRVRGRDEFDFSESKRRLNHREQESVTTARDSERFSIVLNHHNEIQVQPIEDPQQTWSEVADRLDRRAQAKGQLFDPWESSPPDSGWRHCSATPEPPRIWFNGPDVDPLILEMRAANQHLVESDARDRRLIRSRRYVELHRPKAERKRRIDRIVWRRSPYSLRIRMSATTAAAEDSALRLLGKLHRAEGWLKQLRGLARLERKRLAAIRAIYRHRLESCPPLTGAGEECLRKLNGSELLDSLNDLIDVLERRKQELQGPVEGLDGARKWLL